MNLSNPHFFKNIQWNLEQVSVQSVLARKVKGRARSGYYKAAIIIASSVVEALAYKILSRENTERMPWEDWKCIKSNHLSPRYKSEDGNILSICERIKPRFRLEKYTDFKKVNEVCFKLEIFSKRFFRKIEKIRELRNKIHIQGLDNIDRSYTRNELEYISSVINNLLDMLIHGHYH
jgi:hypothetical protein